MPVEAKFVLGHSSYFDGSRLSSNAEVAACRRHGGVCLYIVLRAPAVILSSNVYVSDHLVRDAPYGDPLELVVPLQGLLLCVLPIPDCLKWPRLLALSIFVAEQTLPAVVRPGYILNPKLILESAIEGSTSTSFRLKASLQHDWKSVGKQMLDAGLAGVKCHFRGCNALDLGSGKPKRLNGTVVVDVGAHSQSTFMGWLRQQSNNEPRWLVAIEPNPTVIDRHPSHPRLALLEAAVSNLGTQPHAKLHRTRFDECSSLLPLQAKPMEYTAEVGASDAKCYTPSTSVQVHVVMLRSIIRAIYDQEIAVLKIDTQGSDLAVILSAGSEIRRVRRIVVEVYDLPRGHGRMPYGREQPTKEDIVIALASRGFLMDACKGHSTSPYKEEDCLFVRDDLLEAPPGLDFVAVVSGQYRWDRPGREGPGFYRGEIENDAVDGQNVEFKGVKWRKRV